MSDMVAEYQEAFMQLSSKVPDPVPEGAAAESEGDQTTEADGGKV